VRGRRARADPPGFDPVHAADAVVREERRFIRDVMQTPKAKLRRTFGMPNGIVADLKPSPLHVLHVVASLESVSGGPPMVVSRLAAAQAALDVEVTILSSVPRPGQDTVIPGLRRLPGGEKVTLELVPGDGLIEDLTARRAGRVARRLVKQADIVHLAGVWDPILLAAAREARRADIPYCVAPHGMLDPYALTQSRLKKRLALMAGVRAMLNKASFLQTLNRAERTRMSPLALIPQPEIIPNGISFEEFAELPPSDEFHRSHPELRGEPYILFMGRLHLIKGLDYLADAFAIVARQIAPLRLVMAGPDAGYKDEFARRITELGVADRVHFVGPLYERPKLAALAGASLFCQPSRQEGFSIAITEALAAGVPCVVTEECRFPEIAELDIGAVTPLDSEAIATGLIGVLGRNDRERIGARGRELVKSAYTWPLVARRSIEIYTNYLPALEG
jgi:glycosyltransferase involved in cell wall biosynthesis